MKLVIIFSILLCNSNTKAQQIEKIEIPKGIVYKYCDSITLAKAKTIITKELSNSPNYNLDKGIVFIGPALWSRYSSIKPLNKIKGGDITILGYKKDEPSAKLTQDKNDFKQIWDYLRKEVNSEFILRKATAAELRYYWAVISFDIQEPLIIVETKDHNFILNLSAKDFTLSWLDEAPKN